MVSKPRLEDIAQDLSIAILDVGGVLRDSSEAVYEGYRRGFDREGIALTVSSQQLHRLNGIGKYDHEVEAAEAMIAISQSGADADAVIMDTGAERRIDEMVDRDLPAEGRLAARRIADAFNEFRASQEARKLVRLFPFSRAAVDLLFDLGLKVAIFSNSRKVTIRNDLGSLGLERFCMILNEEDVKVKKPSGEGIRKILDAQGIAPRRAIYIGDSQVDILAARDAGCYCASVLSGSGSRAHIEALEPDFIFDNLMELARELSRTRPRIKV